MLDNRKVAKAGLLMAAVLGLCRFASLGKELYVASVFGAGIVIDAYSLAILVPAIGVSLFVNAVRRAFLAQYPVYRDTSDADAQQFANQYLTSSLVVSVLIASVVSVVLRPIWPTLVAGDRPEIVDSLRELTMIAAWLIVPMSVISGLTAVMNARHHFSTPQWTHVIPTGSVVLFLVVSGSEWGAKALLYGLLAGSVVQCVVLVWMVQQTGHRLRVVFDLRSKTLLALWSLSLPIVVIDMLGQGNVYIDRTMASMLEPGKISVVYWSALMKDFISSTLIASMLWVLLPHFSEQVAHGKTDELRRSCSLVLRYSAILMFPITVLLVVCGPPLLEHLKLGALDRQATTAMAYCLAAYAFGLFAELTSLALAQAVMVLGKLRWLVLIGIFGSFIPNIVFNLLLIGPFAEVGLAASTSLVAWLTLACHYILLKRTIGMHEEGRTIRLLSGTFLAACVMAGVGFGIRMCFETLGNDLPWMGLMGAIIAGIVGIVVFCLLVLVYPGSEDARLAYRIGRDKLLSLVRSSSNNTYDQQ